MSAMSDTEATAGAQPDPWRRPDLRQRRPELLLIKATGSRPATPKGRATLKVQAVPKGRAMPRARAVPVTQGAPRPAAQAVLGDSRAEAVRPAATATPSRLRLTRRGRAVVASTLATAAAAVAALVVMTAAAGAQASDHGRGGGGYAGMREIVVRPGQTLWSIAATAEPSADPRVVVQQIMTVNSLTSTQIQAGQLLWVPR
jgi:hypothetical protein